MIISIIIAAAARRVANPTNTKMPPTNSMAVTAQAQNGPGKNPIDCRYARSLPARDRAGRP
jgi:hypothetical protein